VEQLQAIADQATTHFHERLQRQHDRPVSRR
jgi:hypothetical protein